MENWRDRVSSQSLPTTVAPDPDEAGAGRARERGMEGREDWPTLSPLFFTFPCATSPSNLVSLALSRSLCLSGRRRCRRCRGRRGKKKRLNQEPECSEWELSRSSKGPAAAATLRNISTRFQFLRLEISGEREDGLSNQKRNRMVARFPPLIKAGH